MSSADVVRILNQLRVLHARSLPNYLSDARPWTRSSDQAGMDLLTEIAVAHRDAADRLAELVLERGGTPAEGEYPMPFTGYNDLSFEYLCGKLIERGERAIAVMTELAARLGSDGMAQAVAEELIGEAKGHVDSLREVRQRAAPAMKVTPAADNDSALPSRR